MRKTVDDRGAVLRDLISRDRACTMGTNKWKNKAPFLLLEVSWKGEESAWCVIQNQVSKQPTHWMLPYNLVPELKDLPVGEHREKLWCIAARLPDQWDNRRHM